MTGIIFRSLAATIASATLALADKPLAEAAAPFAKDLPAGSMVTGESIDGKRSYAVFGKAEPDGVAPKKRIYEIGSISKVFTGLLLADAVQAKQVRLDSTLKELLGEKQSFADPKVGEITLLQLTTHTSGLPRLPDNMGPNPDAEKDPYAKYDREKMRAFLAKVTLPPPPHRASYSNFGAGLLGDLLAERSGKNWEALVKEKITGPLGMKDTLVSLDKSQLKRLAPPYRGTEAGTSWTFQALAGAGALRSTAEDLLTFGEALLEPGKTALPGAIQMLMVPRSSYEDVAGEIGLGIIVGKLDGEQEYQHAGGTGGYRSMLQVIPSKKIVRVVMINNDTIPAEKVTAATRVPAVVKETPEVKLTDAELEAFPAVYEIGPMARFTVLRREGALWVRLSGQPFYPVTPMGGDRFRYAVVPAELQFQRENGKDKALTLVLHQNGREIIGKRSEEQLPTILFPKEEELKPYEGQYELAPGRIFTVSVRDGSLIVKLDEQPPFTVFETKPGYFEYDVVKAALEFKKDDEGKVDSLILHQNGDHLAKKK
ncbi:serine hydrolase [Haloferula sp. BvORR071]|uniref:serine hydrolase n=1 Tax=Haloferula sp. BvORR071 TaxID=1396141 RepID=UPI0006960D5C|nr:serine hydrolase [Haloferula sp. BvORR071]